MQIQPKDFEIMTRLIRDTTEGSLDWHSKAGMAHPRGKQYGISSLLLNAGTKYQFPKIRLHPRQRGHW